MISVEVPAWALLFSISHDAMKSALRFFRTAGSPQGGDGREEKRDPGMFLSFSFGTQHLSFFGAAGGRPSRRGWSGGYMRPRHVPKFLFRRAQHSNTPSCLFGISLAWKCASV